MRRKIQTQCSKREARAKSCALRIMAIIPSQGKREFWRFGLAGLAGCTLLATIRLRWES